MQYPTFPTPLTTPEYCNSCGKPFVLYRSSPKGGDPAGTPYCLFCRHVFIGAVFGDRQAKGRC